MERYIPFSLLLAIFFGFPQIVLTKPSDKEEYLKYFQSQISFEQNKGQYESDILFQAFAPQRQVRFLTQGVSFAEIREIVSQPSGPSTSRKYDNYTWMGEREAEHEALVWNIQFMGSNPQAQLKGKQARPGLFNYFKGKQSIKKVQNYQELWYENLFNGIHLRYYGTDKQALKYDFILETGANVASIVMEVSGAEGTNIDGEGNWSVQTSWGEVITGKPYAYQIINGKEIAINVSYKQIGDMQMGFEILETYNPAYPLIIDPLILNWSTFLHSSTSDDYVMAVDRDVDDYIYVTGYTKSLTFPITTGVYQNVYGGGIDCYVTKLDPSGSSLVYSTFMGGVDWEMGYSIAVNSNKEAYVTGFANSTDFPFTSGAFQTNNVNGSVEGFLARLSADGDSLLFSTFIGGSDRDYIYDMKIDDQGYPYMTGYTYSSDFPVTAGAYATVSAGNGDAFVMKFEKDGSAPIYSTFFGGNSYDIANSLVVHSTREVFVAGNTASSNLPTTVGVIQPNANFTSTKTKEDAFVFRLSSDGSTLVYATYLGGTDADGAYAVDINKAGEAFISGTTYSDDFPTTANAYLNNTSNLIGGGDVFVAKLNANGDQLDYSTYLAGTDIDFVKSLRVNDVGEVHLLGATRSGDWPVTSSGYGYQAMYDIFLTVMNSTGSGVLHSSLYGGAYNEYPRASGSLHLDDGRVTLAVTTHSPGVQSTSGGYQNAKMNGLADAPWLLGITVGTVLPVEIVEFQAKWIEEKEAVVLDWLVSSEYEGTTYSIQRKLNGMDWETIGLVIGKHGETTQGRYDFLDTEIPVNNENTEIIYRLAIRDMDGGLSYSRNTKVLLEQDGAFTLKLYPNPSSHVLNIEMKGWENGPVNLEIRDIMGRELWKDSKHHMGQSHWQYDVSSLKAGMYFLRVANTFGRTQIYPFWVNNKN